MPHGIERVVALSQNRSDDATPGVFHLTPPLEAGTIKWGFQRGRASPLVASGVQTPLAILT